MEGSEERRAAGSELPLNGDENVQICESGGERLQTGDDDSRCSSGRDVPCAAVRKSNRMRKNTPTPAAPASRPVARMRVARRGRATRDFSCDMCETPFVVDPRRRSGRAPKQRPTPRHHVDPVTKRRLNLCNACGLASRAARRSGCGGAVKRKDKLQEDRGAATDENKQRYLSEAKRFAFNLVSEYNDANAERLFCPQFKQRACCCIQRYIGAEGDAEESRKRTLLLLQLIKEAKRLSRQKCYSVAEVKTPNYRGRGGAASRSPHPIGLGNGQKKSKMFEEFVLENRGYLRGTLEFCERGTQKILVYSNNFLHKRLKTVPERASRVKRQKGKAALGLLLPVEQLHRQQCCGERCVTLAITHQRLLVSWRERVAAGQAEARRVLAEMLTPSGGARSNCYKFISMVTGCSNSTICRVSEQMKTTGGDREPPEHGLKKWWEENPRPHVQPGAESAECSDSPLTVVPSPPKRAIQSESFPSKPEVPEAVPVSSSLETLSQLQLQYKRVLGLQSQLAKQQAALQQEQQIIEQQMQHQCRVLQAPPPAAAKRPQAVQSTSVILDLPGLQTGRAVSYTLALSDPATGNLLSNSELAATSASNFNITILPQHVTELDSRTDCLPGMSSAGGALNNFVLIQSPSGSIIDSIPLVMDTDYQTTCASNHTYSLIPEASSNVGPTCILEGVANCGGLLQTLNQPGEMTSDSYSANGSRSLLRPSILDLTTIGNPQKSK